jgi:hypothetical protein
MAPEGVKIIGEWTDAGGHRGFLLFEAMDLIPVVDTEKDVMSLLS